MNYFNKVKETLNPWDGEWESALWHYNYRGYLCLVEFSGGRLWNQNSAPLKTNTKEEME